VVPESNEFRIRWTRKFLRADAEQPVGTLRMIEVTGTFGSPGEPARDISYRVQVDADAPKPTIDELIRTTDSVTEIQNTLRAGCAVRLEQA
jgi:hypothetical protein